MKVSLQMTTNEPTAPQGGEDLRPAFSSTGNSAKADAYAIAPEDQHIADAIAKMDPINDVPRPHDVPEGWQMPALRITALPKEMRGELQDRLSNVPEDQRAAAEDRLVSEAIRGMRAELIVKTGVGGNALPFHREMVAVAREFSDIDREANRLVEQLGEIVRYDMRRDPITGEQKPVAVLRLTGTRRAAAEEQLKDLERRARLLFNEDGTRGIEGQRRMRQAMHESVGLLKARNQQVEEDREARRLGEQMNREARINARAAQYASIQRNGG